MSTTGTIAGSVDPTYKKNTVSLLKDGTKRELGSWVSRDYDTFAGNISQKYGSAAENALSQMVQAAQGAVGQTGLNNDLANSSIKGMQSQIENMKGSADYVGQKANEVSKYAGQMSGVADSLTPYAQAMQDYAGKVYGQGQTLVDQGNALLGEWGNFAPLIGNYVSALKSLDPNNKASMAAADVQSSYQNAQGQNQRTMARMGVDPTSGAYQAQKAQWDQALATALAGAKTRAKNQGLNEQIAALSQGLGVGQNLATTGAQIAGTGTDAITQAGGLMGQGADILGQQGSLYQGAGNLTNAAGQLGTAQADIFRNMAGIDEAAASIATSLGTQTVNAQQMLQSALLAATEFYNDQQKSYAAAAGTTGVLRSIFNNAL